MLRDKEETNVGKRTDKDYDWGDREKRDIIKKEEKKNVTGTFQRPVSHDGYMKAKEEAEEKKKKRRRRT